MQKAGYFDTQPSTANYLKEEPLRQRTIATIAQPEYYVYLFQFSLG